MRNIKSDHQSQSKKYAQKLRREMTKEERRLWHDFLKQLPVTVNRQKVIDHYIVDSYCASTKLAIELDGSQHYDERNAASDSLRDQTLNQLGIAVVRYTNQEDSQNFECVCADILRRIGRKDIA